MIPKKQKLLDDTKLRQYRVRDGFEHAGVTGGSIVELTEKNAYPFYDKLAPVKSTDKDEEPENVEAEKPKKRAGKSKEKEEDDFGSKEPQE